MTKFHYQTNGRLRFYIPRAMARLLSWEDKAQISGELDDDGTVVLSKDPPNVVRGYFSRQKEYTMINLPIKHMTGRTRMRIDLLEDDKLVIKFFE